MTSHTVFAVATIAFHFLLASTLEVKRVARNAVSTDSHAEDNSNRDLCSVCEADVNASWDVKCTYKTCGLCAVCNSGKAVDESIERVCSVCEADASASWDVKCTYKTCGLCTACYSDKAEDEIVKDDTEHVAGKMKEESREEGETNQKVCSVCEADMSASWAVKCHYKSCGVCSTCGPDKIATDKAAADVSTDFASQTAMTLEDAPRCQGQDGKMYDDGMTYECTKGKRWQCAHGEWEYMGECDETKEPEDVGALAPKADLPAKPDFKRPRMYVAEGCDESTASTTHAARILALHGINAGKDDENREALAGKPEKVLPRMQTMYENYKSHHMTIMFKSILHRDLEITTSKELVNMGGGTLAVYVTRRNHLDQVVCMIRDCFVNTAKDTTTYGYAVKSDGTPTNMCFERRGADGDAGKAKLRVREHKPNGEYRSYLEESLQKSEQRVADGIAALKKAGYAAPTIASEDLEAFQAGGDNNLQTSLKAWTELLKAWEVEVDIEKLTNYLSSYANTYTPKSQKDTIHNYKEVVNEMNRLGRRDLVHAD